MTSEWSFHVDYYSYTINTPETNKYWIRDNLADIFESQVEMDSTHVYNASDWQLANPRRPYQMTLRSSEIGCSVYFGGQSTLLFEHSGQGCKVLRDVGKLNELIKNTHSRCTRLDIACDIESNISPSEFADAGYSGNIRTRNDRKSDTGHTVTLGSWKSERFVNVYRYYEPHPRHKTLRVEFRLKRDYARNACKYLLSYDASHVVAMLDNSYKFNHQMWRSKKVNERLPGRPDNKNSESTLLWILKQVAPAIQKLIREGVIDDPDEFFDKHFKPDAVQGRMFDND